MAHRRQLSKALVTNATKHTVATPDERRMKDLNWDRHNRALQERLKSISLKATSMLMRGPDVDAVAVSLIGRHTQQCVIKTR